MKCKQCDYETDDGLMMHAHLEAHELAALRARVAELEHALKEVESLCDSEMGDWDCVLPPYIPDEMMGLFNIREAVRTALVESQ